MILDCDLLIGRDIAVGSTLNPAALTGRLKQAGIAGGAVASLRALLYNARSGNEETSLAVSENAWLPVWGIDLRDPLGAQTEIEQAAARGIRLVRIAPGRQGIAPTAPRLRLLVASAVANGITILIEGSTADTASSLMGLGASVVFLDQHFYDLGEFIMVAREEAGFHLSTRLLGSPGAWELVAAEVGAERLVFGSRAGWFEEQAVLHRLATAQLTDAERTLVAEGNLRRLGGEYS
ncbi:hypothetical protein [Microbacterium sp.]|uniref:hypothetical protein n=1 Tax=Microbacterium sp. TaxID=51671 RepID=UPI0027339EC4|nr:hypothetical protein [Microbacterium sp.]MDP3951399.1 hypothetical protein [Microbacterium sp.]